MKIRIALLALVPLALSLACTDCNKIPAAKVQATSGEFEAAVARTADLKTKGLDLMKSIGMSQ
jgi:hypothetical protein